MVDTAITGMFARNAKTPVSDIKKANQSAAFTEIMAKSMSNLLPITSTMNSVKQVMSGSKTSMDNMFVKTNSQADFSKASNTDKSESNEVTKADVLTQNPSVKQTANKTNESEEEVCNNEEDTNNEESVHRVMSEMIETIKKLLGISDEEYQKAMSELGLVSVDLLEPNNVADLIAQLSGKQDTMFVITDSELSLKLKEVTQTISDMMTNAQQQYGISEEQFKELAQTNIDNAKESNVQKQQAQPEEFIPEEDVRLEEVISEKIITSSSDNKNGSNTFANHSNADHKQDGLENSKNNIEANSDMSGVNVAAQLAKTFEAAFANEFDVKPIDVVRQVVDSIKLHVNSQVKSMEIALNPENLGKVNLLVSVREGVVTAKLVAENEQVKKALEGQLNVLKENMSNQGLKVDAVEVTVQNNAFNSQENFNGNNPQQQTNGTKKHNISLSFTEDEEVTESHEETTTISQNSSVEFSA